MKRNIILFLLTLLSASANAQISSDTILKPFNTFRESAYSEKVFVHTDREFYLTGEIMWFRFFLADGASHVPGDLSKVGYVELLDRNNKQVLQTKIELETSGGNGSVFLPASIPSGSYQLRAYTRWMRNFSPEFYFSKNITIVNPFLRPEILTTKTERKIVAEFFPEGGNLVAGITSRVGFRVVGPDGRGISFEGAVLNDNGDTVRTFKPGAFGIGSFKLRPEHGVNYRCVIREKSGNVSAHKFPEVYREGYVMHVVDSSADHLVVKVTAKKSFTSLPYVYLLAHSRQRMVHGESKPIYPSQAVFVIDRKKIPDGILHLTVFDEERKPVAERLYFRAPVEPLKVTAVVNQPSFSPRRKVSVAVSTSSAGKPSPARFSVSVFRVDSLASGPGTDIASWLLLSSDLRGEVESPEYYLDGLNDEKKEAVDNLMLTHGWRRFSWNEVIGRKQAFSVIPEFRTHLVNGKVTRQNGTPVPGILTYLASPGKLVNVYGSRSNEKGEVFFEVKDFWENRKLIMQSNTEIDSTVKLSVVDPFSDVFAKRNIPDFALAENQAEEISLRSLAMQVQDIYYREKNNRITSVKSDSTAFYGKADETYYLDNYTRFPVMEEVMREYVAGVLVRKRRDGFHFIVLDMLKGGVLQGEPMVLLDGVPVFDTDKIMAFNPLLIRKTEVVKRIYFAGPLVIPGIVSYYTYSGDLAGFELDPRSVSVNYEGLQLQRDYYSPSYETQKQRSSRLPDQRTLLYWGPDLRTTEDGTVQTGFFTSDLEGTFCVEIQALGDKGSAGSTKTFFTVKRADF